MPDQSSFDLQAKFRALSRALKAEYEALRVGGEHGYEKGIRSEAALCEFLRRHLPPRYGVARGEVVSADGRASRQLDVVIYDAFYSPLLQVNEASSIFPAECVYAVIEMKPTLSKSDLASAVKTISSAKALDRSAIVPMHGGHMIRHGPKRNAPMFGAVFALDSVDVPRILVPALIEHHRKLVAERWIDCVCILNKALLYHFISASTPAGESLWVPTVLRRGARLGWIDCEADALYLFYLYLLYQLNMKDLFPPDLMRYAAGLRQVQPTVFDGPEYPRIDEE